MLVLTRKSGQKIWIGDSICIEVRVRDRQMSVMIDAPTDVKILREELKKRDEENGKCGRTSR